MRWARGPSRRSGDDRTGVHLIRDIGAFQVGIGAVLMLAVPIRDALLAALAGAATGATFHLLGHLIDHDLGGRAVVDLPVFGLTAALLVVAAVARASQGVRRS